MGLSLEGVFEIDRWLQRYHPTVQKPETTTTVSFATPATGTSETTRVFEFASRPPNPPPIQWVMR